MLVKAFNPIKMKSDCTDILKEKHKWQSRECPVLSGHIKSLAMNKPPSEIQGKAKHGKAKASQLSSDTSALEMKAHNANIKEDKSGLYSGYDTDLAVDNLENDLPEADKRSF